MQVEGLSSGLDTTSIINSLMAIERAPQDALVARQNKARAAVDAFGSIKAKLDDLASATAKLATADRWNVMVASLSKEGVVSVATAEGAAAMALSFSVDQLAAGHSVRSVGVVADLDTVIAPSGSVSIDTGSAPMPIAVGTGTLAEVVQAINDSDLGVVAAAVDTGSGYRLQVTSESTGATSAFSLAGIDDAGGAVVASTGRDAQITIGEGAGAYSVSSSSNTFAELLPGVTIEAHMVSTEPISVTISRDESALTERVKGFVDALNGVLGEARKHSTYDASSGASGPLAGDPSVRRLVRSLTEALTRAVPSSSIATAGQVGIRLDRDGTFTFEPDRFEAAINSDPAAVVALFSDSGLAQRAADAVDEANSFTTGYITVATDGRQTKVDTLEDSIRAFDHRLEIREQRMRQYWANLEIALGNMQRQSSWLAGQLAGLA